MKPIIVPTDFSPAADAAIAYAAGLATVTGSTIILTHAYEMPVTTTDFPMVMISPDELKHAADAGLKGIKEEAVKQFPEVNFETESRLGEAMETSAGIAAERNALCIVAGVQKLTGVEKFLFGNEALSMVKNSALPVITVPENTTARAPKNIVLAIDFTHLNEMPVAGITGFIQAVQAHLHIVHIETEEEEKTIPENIKELFAGVSVSIDIVQSKEVAEGLNTYLIDRGADLLMLLPHKHSFYERLFSKTHTADIMNLITLPIVCLQS